MLSPNLFLILSWAWQNSVHSVLWLFVILLIILGWLGIIITGQIHQGQVFTNLPSVFSMEQSSVSWKWAGFQKKILKVSYGDVTVAFLQCVFGV